MKKIMVITALIATASFFSVQAFWDWEKSVECASTFSQLPDNDNENKMVRDGCLHIDVSDPTSSNNQAEDSNQAENPVEPMDVDPYDLTSNQAENSVEQIRAKMSKLLLKKKILIASSQEKRKK